MVPKGWSETRLGTVFKNRREKGRDGLPTLSVTLNDGLVDRSLLDRKTDTTLQSHEHLAVMPGDIAYNMMRMWQGASGLSDRNALVSPAYVVLKPTNAIHGLYAAYLFKSPRMIHLFWAYSYGLTNDRLRLYFRDFSIIPVALPPVDEQRRIGQILSTWDRAIEATENLIENTRSQKRALMQRLLTPPRITASPASGSKWERMTLDQLGEFYAGVTYSPSDVTDSSGLLVLRSSNVQDGQITLDDNVYVRAGVKVKTTTRVGDIVICVRNGSRDLIGKTAQISPDTTNLAHGAFMSLFRPKGEVEFCRHLFKTPNFEKLVAQNLGATINSINTSDLRQFSFLLPPKSEWRAIGQMLSSHERCAALLQAQRRNLKQQHKTLMQQLITGKRRVMPTNAFKGRANA